MRGEVLTRMLSFSMLSPTMTRTIESVENTRLETRDGGAPVSRAQEGGSLDIAPADLPREQQTHASFLWPFPRKKPDGLKKQAEVVAETYRRQQANENAALDARDMLLETRARAFEAMRMRIRAEMQRLKKFKEREALKEAADTAPAELLTAEVVVASGFFVGPLLSTKVSAPYPEAGLLSESQFTLEGKLLSVRIDPMTEHELNSIPELQRLDTYIDKSVGKNYTTMIRLVEPTAEDRASVQKDTSDRDFQFIRYEVVIAPAVKTPNPEPITT